MLRQKQPYLHAVKLLRLKLYSCGFWFIAKQTLILWKVERIHSRILVHRLLQNQPYLL